MKVHKGIKSFVFKMCDKSFSVHEGNKPFKCKFILNQDYSDTLNFLLDIKTAILDIL